MKKIAFLLTVLLWQIAFTQINVTITGQQSPEIGVSYQYQIQASKKSSAPSNATSIVIERYIIKTLYNGTGQQINGTINNVVTQYDVVNTSLNLINRNIVWGDFSDIPTDEISVEVQGYFRDSNGNNIGAFSSIDSKGTLNINKQTIQITNITGKSVPNCCTDNQTHTVQSTGNSFSWSLSGGATFVGANTGSSITVTPPATGNYSVTVTARRTSASQNYFRTATGTVTRTERTADFTALYPNGNPYNVQFICKGTGRQMQTPNQCGISSVNWVAPNCTISGQGTLNPTIIPNSGVAIGSTIDVYAVVSFIGGCTATTPTKSFTVFDSAAPTTPTGYFEYTSNTGQLCNAEIFELDFIDSNFNNGVSTTSPDFIFGPGDEIHYDPSRTLKITVCNRNLCTGTSNCKNYYIQAPAPCNVEKIVNSTLKIAPNPNNGEFTVFFEKEISGKYIVYDSMGTIVKQGNIVSSKAEKINIGKQKQGNYFIKVLTDSQEEFQQIIIIK